ncbi:Protein kinase-like domain [Pseudocohnilembus persalinus]|uniref:Protein kinase-like domain n=1 Tax=Pseudocohnilembus persalinus TaxID=266149 RepID=A0A0V0R3I5_PSEPJ|nr:Protein kinase-like domain [Pseudocohnilembus persalinus]|eukprot:KRX09044.1 Protein kinase-like domain [Pseudocohnilembus persalinus]
MEALNIQLDACKISEDRCIKNQLSQGGETFILSTQIYKFNDYKKKQERNVMLTSRAFYNLKGKTIKRKIELQSIQAITIGKFGKEFILHIANEYDYRYESQKRDAILYQIVKAIKQCTGNKIKLFQKDDINLAAFSTTKADKKKGVERMPKEGAIDIDETDWKSLNDMQEEEENQIRSQRTTIYSSRDRQVDLDDFQLIKVLGKGGFGIVFLVEDKMTGEQHAMKVLQKTFLMKHGQVENTKVEKMILEHVNHPFLVSLLYAFQDPKNLYFVTELMKCGELYEHMVESRRFNEERARFYTVQLALGLGHLHGKGFVYRDLKLENILVDDKGNVHLADFGLSKLIKNNELAMSICGTPEYMSPEVIRGQGCDMTTDWWALGTLVYEMMFGLPPFYSKIKNQMLDRIQNENLRFPEKPLVSDAAKDFICKCLVKDRTKRLGSKKDVEDILNHPWFNGINIQLMLQKKLTAPYIPDPSKIYLDEQIQSMEPRISISQKSEIDKDDPFKDF